MPGLVPGIHFFSRVSRSLCESVDGRNKCGHDVVGVRGGPLVCRVRDAAPAPALRDVRETLRARATRGAGDSGPRVLLRRANEPEGLRSPHHRAVQGAGPVCEGRGMFRENAGSGVRAERGAGRGRGAGAAGGRGRRALRERASGTGRGFAGGVGRSVAGGGVALSRFISLYLTLSRLVSLCLGLSRFISPKNTPADTEMSGRAGRGGNARGDYPSVPNARRSAAQAVAWASAATSKRPVAVQKPWMWPS